MYWSGSSPAYGQWGLPEDEVTSMKHYFLYRGLSSTAKSFENELKQDSNKAFRVDKVMDQLMTYISNFDVISLKDYWTFLEQTIFSELEGNQQTGVVKLYNRCLKYYLIHACQQGKSDKVLEFFEKMSGCLSDSEEWRDWFALPFTKNPEESLPFSKHFNKQWQDTFLLTLHNFLCTILANLKKPMLLNYENDRRRITNLELENATLKLKIENLMRENAPVNQREATPIDQYSTNRMEVLDDFFDLKRPRQTTTTTATTITTTTTSEFATSATTTSTTTTTATTTTTTNPLTSRNSLSNLIRNFTAPSINSDRKLEKKSIGSSTTTTTTTTSTTINKNTSEFTNNNNNNNLPSLPQQPTSTPAMINTVNSCSSFFNVFSTPNSTTTTTTMTSATTTTTTTNVTATTNTVNQITSTVTITKPQTTTTTTTSTTTITMTNDIPTSKLTTSMTVTPQQQHNLSRSSVSPNFGSRCFASKGNAASFSSADSFEESRARIPFKVTPPADKKRTSEGSSSCDDDDFINRRKREYQVMRRDDFTEHSAPVVMCRISSQGKSIASLDAEGVMKIWSWQPLPTTTASTMSKSVLTTLEWLSTSERYLLLGSRVGSVRIFDSKDRLVVKELSTDSNYPKLTCISSNPCGTTFVTSSTGRLLNNGSLYGQQPQQQQQQQQQQQLLSKQMRVGKLTVWDLKDDVKKERALPISPGPIAINCMTHNKCGSLLLCGGVDGVVRLYDMRVCNVVLQWQCSTVSNDITTVSFAGNDNACYVMDVEGVLSKWSLLNVSQKVFEQTVERFDSNQNSIYNYNVGGRSFVLNDSSTHALIGYGSNAAVYRFINDVKFEEVLNLGDHVDAITCVDWLECRSSNTLITATNKGNIKIVQLKTF